MPEPNIPLITPLLATLRNEYMVGTEGRLTRLEVGQDHQTAVLSDLVTRMYSLEKLAQRLVIGVTIVAFISAPETALRIARVLLDLLR